MWKCIRVMQHRRRGLRPSRVVSIEDEDGVPCVTTDTQHQRWRRHFNNVLNTRTRFVAEEMERVRQREVRADIANIPSQLEVTKAVGKLKNAMECYVLSDVEGRTRERKFCWDDNRTGQDSLGEVCAHTTKKGNLHRCDNWRGIAVRSCGKGDGQSSTRKVAEGS